MPSGGKRNLGIARTKSQLCEAASCPQGTDRSDSVMVDSQLLLCCELAFAGLFGLCALHAAAAKSIVSLLVAVAYGAIVEYLVYVFVEHIEPRLYDHADGFWAILPGGVPVSDVSARILKLANCVPA